MLQGWVIVTVSFAYLGVLFAIAYYGDKRADAGRSIIAKPTIYALSLAVYCTAWTFYGSVGRAAAGGLDFLPTYIGPTLLCALGWVVLRKIVRISKVHRITSIADFIASRYGKSQMLGGLVGVWLHRDEKSSDSAPYWFSSAVIAGTMASSSGSASAAPAPRRNVRRGSAPLVTIMSRFSC